MTTRREFLGTVAGGLGLGALAAGPAARPAPRGPLRNLLFFSFDDLNDWVGPLAAHPGVRTPNLDRLAAGGVTFTRAYTASPKCGAARASLVTGVHTATHGVHSNQPTFETLQATVPWLVQLPAHLRANGWKTLGAGKIYHGPNAPAFDEYRQARHDPLPPNRPLNGIPGADTFDWGPVDAPDDRMGDAGLAEWAAEQVAQAHDRPFFLACGFGKPHLPWFVPPAYFEPFPLETLELPLVLDTDLDDVPPIGRHLAQATGNHADVVTTNNWARAVQGYLASIYFVDAQVGRVLDALEAGPNAGTTAVVVWSDHGFHLGEKLHWRKFALWEEATRIPLIVRVPGVSAPGARCERTVSSIDLYPTFNALFGLPPVPHLEGHDLTALLRSPGAPWPWPAVSIYDGEHATVRTERWRYIRYGDGTEELYDHDADPLEWTNLAADPVLAPVVLALRAHIPLLVTTGPGPEPVPEEEMEEESVAYPNPARSAVTIEFLLSSATELTLSVYDMGGRRVYQEAQGRLDAGRHRVGWAGRGGDGRRLPSGSYVCRVHGAGYAATHRVLLVR
jgi:arylsulfatase A-like enzyme